MVVGSRGVLGRTLAKWWRGFALSLLAGLGACAGQTSEPDDTPCVELCEIAKDDCPDAPSGDCVDYCLAEDYRVERTGCRSTYEALIECSLELTDVCSAVSGCSAELNAYRQCVGAYCGEHPSDDACRGTRQ